MYAFIATLSCVLIAVILWDAFETIVLPRRVTRRFRVTALFYRLTWRPWSAFAVRLRKPRRREAYLGYYGPLSTLFLLTLWATSMIFGFAGLNWALRTPLTAPEKPIDFWTYLYMSGTNYFTVGLGDVTAQRGIGRFLTVLEGGVGFGFLALIMGYFPVLYQAFSKREVSIALLDARAGSPSSSVELLRHFARTGSLGKLDDSLHEIEHWNGELLESHISYPVLSYFRSQHDNQSWLGAITTVLDTCALLMVGVHEAPSRQAALTFAIARHAVVDIAQILKTAPRPPEPDRLPAEGFAKLLNALAEAGLHMPDGREAEIRLRELREAYEPYVAALSRHLSMRLPQWVPDRRVIHNWETSAWGRKVSPAGSTASPSPVVDDDHMP